LKLDQALRPDVAHVVEPDRVGESFFSSVLSHGITFVVTLLSEQPGQRFTEYLRPQEQRRNISESLSIAIPSKTDKVV
jgi:hypothetical protein